MPTFDRRRPDRSKLAPALALALALIACGGRSETAAQPTAPSESRAGEADASTTAAATAAVDLHRGIDVSAYSGEVDWRAVAAAGHTFAIVKATEGVDLVDPSFAEHWRQLGDSGLVRGAYHFYVTEDDPEAQARFFIETVSLEPGDLVPVVDVERIGHGTRPGLADRLKTFVGRLEAHYGVKPMIYTSPVFWDEHVGAAFGGHPLWVAEYGVDEPKIPQGWQGWHLWQWKEDADVPGVAGGADLSRVNRGRPDLARLVIPQGADPR